MSGGEGPLEQSDPFQGIPDTFGETLDAEEAPAYLAPRLAAYAAPNSQEDVSADEDGDEGEEGEVGDVHARRSRPQLRENEEAEGDGSLEEPSVMEIGDETGGAAPAGSTLAEEPDDVETFDYDDEAGGDEDAADDEEEGNDGHGADTEGRSGEGNHVRVGEDLAGVFPVSRVKDLLKYEGSSAIISRDACLAASEAVALILRDMAKSAAAEAQRRNRKTVAYDDIARTVQLFDRLSYLTEVIPPVPSTKPAAAGRGAGSAGVVLVSAHGDDALRTGKAQRSRQLEQQQPQRAEGTLRGSAQGRGRAPGQREPKGSLKGKLQTPIVASSSSGHPVIPGADSKRQTTLRF